MAESMSGVESTLWRIAELGARCGQRGRGVDHRPLWAELERIIADISDELTAARQGAPIGPPELRRLRKQLAAAIEERDNERTWAEQRLADATARLEAAVAERDAAVAARHASLDEFERAVSRLAARAAGQIISLPEVVAPEAGTEAAPAEPVRWRPTWSEWADVADGPIEARTGTDAARTAGSRSRRRRAAGPR
jgi:hypothetical protein